MADSPLTRGGGGPSDSPLLGTGRGRSGSMTIRPQPVTEKSLMESVAGFINEVQAFNQPGTDPKCQVTWARFETADINDSSLFCSSSDSNPLPLLLVLGYTQGVQLWLIPGSGEAKLVLSWFHGQVKALRILPTPRLTQEDTDPYRQSRPLVALCDSAGPGPAFMSISFVSLVTGDQVHNIKFNCEVADVCVNKRVICVAFRERVAIFDAVTLKDQVTITTCYPSPGVHSNPLALHDRWLAYSDRALCVARRSAGGMEGELGQSVTAWGINVGSKLASGVTKVVSNMFSGSPRSASSSVGSGGPVGTPGVEGYSGETGVVTILDMVDLVGSDGGDGQNIDISNSKVEGVVAHFVAHTRAIVGLQWDPSGSLLLTADKPGHSFHLFRVVAHPLGSAFAAVHHLYTLYRGDTPGSVQDMTFSSDARWVTVSTLRGTTHIFPICPYGGPVGVRTHTSHRVVNKLSRFHRSAGLNENPPTTSSGRNSPNPTLGSSPGASKGFEYPPGVFLGQHVAYPCPHLPPYPSPTIVQPIAQLKQPYIVTLTSQVNLAGVRKPVHGKRNSVPDDVPIRLACTFGQSRARVLHGVHAGFPRQSKKPVESLFVMANHGQLLEYSLDPVPDQTLPKDKVCESSPIDLNIVTYGQWNLGKQGGRDRPEVSPPLDASNPLLLSADRLGSTESIWQDDDNEDRWLSQVEIVSHIGPARRLWMGPQFSFRTFSHQGDKEDDLGDLDVTVTCRPQQSEPMQMPGGSPIHRSQKPVYIECGSANSFELSPRFSNLSIRRSREEVPLEMDVESELREAMSDTVSRESVRKIGRRNPDGDEEFFCLSTEDVRSTPAISEGARTRHPSGTSVTSRSRHSSISSVSRPVEMATAESKIFSVAVQQGKGGDTAMRNLVLKDVEKQMIDRPVILSKKESVEKPSNSEDEFKPVQRDTIDHVPGFVESKDLVGELESALSQETAPEEETESKKTSKKNKKKNKVTETLPPSSADEMREVEVKPKKKKNKNKEKEKEEKLDKNENCPMPIVCQPSKSENIQTLTLDDASCKVQEPISSNEYKKQTQTYKKEENANATEYESQEIFEEFVITKQPKSCEILHEETPAKMCEEFSEMKMSYKKEVSPERDLVEFSEEDTAQIVEIDDDDSEKVDFFIKEKSSSVEPDDEIHSSSIKIDPMGAKPNPWLDDFLKKSSSMIEDQIFGAVEKYENDEDRCSEDEGLIQLEKKEDDMKKDIAGLLEDEEEPQHKTVAEKFSSSLSQLLKGDPKKATTREEINDDTSDDDFMFRPVPTKRNKKKQKHKSAESEEEFYKCHGDSSAADSESEIISDHDLVGSVKSDTKDGWSFEVDENDVNKLLETAETDKNISSSDTGERTALEDVFRFDSEMHDEEKTGRDACGTEVTSGRLAVSVEDLNDALMEETVENPNVSTQQEVEEKAGACTASVTSSSYAGTSCTESESSTTNSPNPRAANTGKNKNKKGKKKKR